VNNIPFFSKRRTIEVSRNKHKLLNIRVLICYTCNDNIQSHYQSHLHDTPLPILANLAFKYMPVVEIPDGC
jgi:hypothetical protein